MQLNCVLEMSCTKNKICILSLSPSCVNILQACLCVIPSDLCWSSSLRSPLLLSCLIEEEAVFSAAKILLARVLGVLNCRVLLGCNLHLHGVLLCKACLNQSEEVTAGHVEEQVGVRRIKKRFVGASVTRHDSVLNSNLKNSLWNWFSLV